MYLSISDRSNSANSDGSEGEVTTIHLQFLIPTRFINCLETAQVNGPKSEISADVRN